MLKIAYSEVYKYHLPEGHRFPMEKYELLPQQLLHEGIVTSDNFFHPDQLTEEEILLTHDPAYLHKLNHLTLSRKEERNIGFPVQKALVERGKYIANGTYQCSLYALQNGVAMNIAGGTHHAYPDKGEGFCVFNDISIATNLLLDRGQVNKVLIVDLDVHQGNGNAFIFQQNPDVFTFSMHGAKNYPLRKEVSNLDIGLEDGTDDKTYLDLLTNTLPRIIEENEPEIIFYQSGVDILETDKLGRLGVSLEGCRQRDHFVFNQAKINDVPIVATMGGGYSHRISDIINAHANTFKEAQYVFF
ncbi:MAG: histone deacetylase [Saprospiraceae bacterium]|nr:histone deacetylase [Saprospiraceae bacterium]